MLPRGLTRWVFKFIVSFFWCLLLVQYTNQPNFGKIVNGAILKWTKSPLQWHKQSIVWVAAALSLLSLLWHQYFLTLQIFHSPILCRLKDTFEKLSSASRYKGCRPAHSLKPLSGCWVNLKSYLLSSIACRNPLYFDPNFGFLTSHTWKIPYNTAGNASDSACRLRDMW